jgi:hypothetical protein
MRLTIDRTSRAEPCSQRRTYTDGNTMTGPEAGQELRCHQACVSPLADALAHNGRMGRMQLPLLPAVDGIASVSSSSCMRLRLHMKDVMLADQWVTFLPLQLRNSSGGRLAAGPDALYACARVCLLNTRTTKAGRTGCCSVLACACGLCFIIAWGLGLLIRLLSGTTPWTHGDANAFLPHSVGVPCFHAAPLGRHAPRSAAGCTRDGSPFTIVMRALIAPLHHMHGRPARRNTAVLV